MIERNVASAIAYYKAMNDKDIAGMGRHLHPDVQLVTPMEHLTGKEAVLRPPRDWRIIFRGSRCMRSSVRRNRPW
jgi:hypothetical protein